MCVCAFLLSVIVMKTENPGIKGTFGLIWCILECKVGKNPRCRICNQVDAVLTQLLKRVKEQENRKNKKKGNLGALIVQNGYIV